MEIKLGSTLGKRIFSVWFIIIKYVAPLAIVIVFLDVLGLLRF